MLEGRKICKCRNVSYLDIREAIRNGAKDMEDIMRKTGVATCCGGCTSEVLTILDSICRCNSVSINEVINVVNSGADSVDMVGVMTKAGTTCGRCRPLIEDIIKVKR